MKFSEFLKGVGRPVSFYPGLAKALGDIKEALFVCQMFYWRDKGSDPDGWIYKTAEEVEDETALTYKEQTRVRERLKKKSLLEEHYARTEHVIYYRVDWDAVDQLWDEYMTKEHMTDGKVVKKHNTGGHVPPSQTSDGSLPKGDSLNSNSENTQENTHKRGDVIDGMIHYGKVKAPRYTNRDKLEFSEDYLRYADIYVELIGKDPDGQYIQVPTKRVLHDWIATFEEWKQERLTAEHLQAAYQHANRPDGGFPVGRPGALTNTAVAMKSKLLAKPQTPQVNAAAVEQTKQLIEEKTGGTFVPRPSNITPPALALKELARQKGIRR